MKVPNTILVDYGIQTESSDWRAHVSVTAGKVYVYPTKLAVDMLKNTNKYRKVPVYTPINGVKHKTAEGYIVPWKEIPRILPVNAKPLIEKAAIRKDDDQTTKGEKALGVVNKLLRWGWFPLGWEPNIIENLDMQYQGLDIVVTGSHRIQVKCDYEAGEPGTGNLFLQVAECNPLGMK